MIDINNYKRAIAWLRRSILQLERGPEDQLALLDARHCFQVTFNISEEFLRRAYVAVANDEMAAFVSGRELLYRAADEGLGLSTNKHWLEYGLMLERLDEQFFESAVLPCDAALVPMLHRYADELEVFAASLERRVSVA